MNRLSILTAILILLAAPLFAQVPCDKSQLCPASGGGSTPSVVATGHCSGNAVTSCSGTMTATPAAGDRIVIFQATPVTNSTPKICTTSPCSSSSETVTAYAGCSNNSGQVENCWMVNAAVGGYAGFTCTASSSTIIGCGVIVLSAPSGLSSPGDATGAGNSSSTVTSFNTATTAAITNANDALIALNSPYAAGATPSCGGSFVQKVLDNAQDEVIQICYYAPGGLSLTTQSQTGTNSTAVYWSNAIIAVKP